MNTNEYKRNEKQIIENYVTKINQIDKLYTVYYDRMKQELKYLKEKYTNKNE